MVLHSTGKALCFGFLFILTGPDDLVAQSSAEGQNTTKWIDADIGLIWDLGVRVMNYSAWSVGVEANYGISSVIFSMELRYSKEITAMVADYGPPAEILNGGISIGKIYTGGRNGHRITEFSAGLGLIHARYFKGAGPYLFREENFTTICFPLEGKLFWIKNSLGWGLGIKANISPEFSYLGISINFILGTFRK